MLLATDYYRFRNGKIMGWRLDYNHLWEFFDLTTGEGMDSPSLRWGGETVQHIDCGPDATDVRFVKGLHYRDGPLETSFDWFIVNIFSLEGEYLSYMWLKRDRPSYSEAFYSSPFLSFDSRRYVRSVFQVMYYGSVENHYELVDACAVEGFRVETAASVAHN